MKIDRITLYNVQMPLVAHFETSFGRIYARDCLIVRVDAGDYTGWGECPVDRDPGYSYETTQTAWHILRDYLIPRLVNQPLRDPFDYTQMSRFVRGHQIAKSAIEMALWDIKGLQSNTSLQQMLGGQRTSVPVGVSVGIQDTAADLVQTVAGYVHSGYARIKLKIKPGRDVADVAAVREAFPDIQLQVDANSAYTLDTAAKLLPLDAHNLLLIEQPLAEDDLWDHRILQAQLTTPICLDESITSPRHARQALEMKACQVINIKQSRVGGLTHAVEIHDLAQAQDIPVWCGGMLETGIGRSANLALASLPGFTLPGDISATDRYYLEDVTEERFTLNTDSTIHVPTSPGIGVHVDEKALAKYTLDRIVME